MAGSCSGDGEDASSLDEWIEECTREEHAEFAARHQESLNNILHDAAEAGDVVRLRQAIASGADVNASIGRECAGWRNHRLTALCSAVLAGKVYNNRAEEGRTACVRALLAAGAAASDALVFWEGDEIPSYAALHDAAYGGLARISRLLLDAGVDVNIRTAGDQTPLHWAALKGRHRTVVLLLSRGATTDGCTGNFEEYYSPGYLSRISSAGSFANYQKQQRAKLMAMLAPKMSHLLPPELVSHVITFWGHLGWT